MCPSRFSPLSVVLSSLASDRQAVGKRLSESGSLDHLRHPGMSSSRDPQGFVVCYTNWDQDQNQDLDPGSKAYREDDIKDFHSPAGDPLNSPRCEASKFSSDELCEFSAAIGCKFPRECSLCHPLRLISHCSAEFLTLPLMNVPLMKRP